jgi:SAM-dependent methyltransferase
MDAPPPDLTMTSDPRAAELAREYERRFGQKAGYRRRVWATLTREVFQRYVPEDGIVLELGSGWGEFINQIRAGTKIGMDLNPQAGPRLDAGIRFLEQDCSATWPLADNSLDVVFTSNFFEHLPDKPTLSRTLREALRCLRPGGRLVCLGPNIRYVPAAYWDFWDHYLPLTDRSLVEGLELAGFAIEEVLPRFLPYTMSQQRTPPIWMLWLYLRLPIVWRIFGRQFLVVAVKPPA